MDLLDEALKAGPDLVCLPEAFTTMGMADLTIDQRAETVPGPTTDAAAKRARENRCYVICPIKRKDGEAYRNTAVILDRTGCVAGMYDKACPVTTTPDYTVVEGGVTPGAEDIPVFDLDFGRIGIQICFDLGFPENWACLARKDARLVFWPSAYDGGFPLRCFAYLHHYYVVSSVRSGASRIIDPLGAIGEETEPDRLVVQRDINLDFFVYHNDFNRSVADRIAGRYRDRVAVWDSAPGSSHTVVEPVVSDLSTGEIRRSIGIEPTAQYHQRHRDAYRYLRSGEAAPPQAAAHGDRAQYGE